MTVQEATVRPPPTIATAVATAARRLFFFHRASWRRRAARPCGAGGASSAAISCAGAATGAVSPGPKSGRPSEAAGFSHDGTAGRTAEGGAMSGA
ncbi:hypothetical protein N8I87_03200 [Streptomyces sp. HUAS TT20]|nr:hypothetical protein [Streptomyces sp. HUAS 15-9]UXY25670.1 hypothetical protein N8I87_03200 [Streptomyces sp. HUAS 15-9]